MNDTDRPISSVLSDIVGNVQHIVRAEVKLAKAEVQEEFAKAKRGMIFLAAGGMAAALAVVFILLAAVYALALVWPMWAAALVVGAGTALVGYAVVTTGMRQIRSVSLRPPRTVSTIQENIEWAKTRTR
jgi:uncharacterized membrane protein YqjE